MENRGTFDRLWRRARGKAGNYGSNLQVGHGVKATDGQPQPPFPEATPVTPAEPDRPNRNSVVPATRRDYWVDASAKLKRSKPEIYEKLLLAIEEESHGSGTLEERVRSVVSQNISTITDRQWRIRWGARLDIPMRGMLEGVVRALEKFKDIGSTAASLDPVHAGLPRTVGLDRIATIVARYSAMENAYTRQGDFSLSSNCEDAIVDLYTRILEYQAIAAAFLGKRTPSRYISAVIKPEDFEGVLKEVRELDDECTKSIRALEAEISEKSGHRLESLMAIAEKILETIQSRNDINETIGLWLSGHEYGADHDRVRNALGSAYTDSGRWLLEGSSYLDWKDGRLISPVLWLRGPVGTGKSSLTSIVIQKHLEELGSSTQERLAYFYCSESAQPSTTSLMVFRSLLLQLAWSSDGLTIHDEVQMLYATTKRTSGSGRPDIEQSVAYIRILASACPKVIVIIDPLDECADYWVLLEGLEQLNQISPKNHVSFFFSSRMHVEVSKYFPRSTIVGPEGNSQDIARYIKTQMANPHGRLLEGKHPYLEGRLQRVLIARAQNLFRWVQLQLELFLSPKYRKKLPKDVTSSLDDLDLHIGKGVPQLNAIYDKIYRMNTDGQPYAQALAKRVLKWILLPLLGVGDPIQRQDAAEMVKLDNVVNAMSISADCSHDPDIDVDSIANLCSNLIVVDDITHSFRVAHLSVVEYLQNRIVQEESPTDKEFAFTQVSAEVARSCLSQIVYLTRTSKARRRAAIPSPSRPKYFRKYTSVGHVPTVRSLGISRIFLLRFAVLYWPSYWLYASSKNCEDEELKLLLEKVMLEGTQSPELTFWMEEYKLFCAESFPSRIHGLSFRPSFETGIGATVSPVSAVRQLIDPIALYGETLGPDGPPSRAFVAAFFGLEPVIARATDVELAEKNISKQTNLQVAAAMGHVSVVKALLKREPVLRDINVSSPTRNMFLVFTEERNRILGSRATALHFALLSKEGCTEIVATLLEAGANPEEGNSNGFAFGNLPTIESLIPTGAFAKR